MPKVRGDLHLLTEFVGFLRAGCVAVATLGLGVFVENMRHRTLDTDFVVHPVLKHPY